MNKNYRIVVLATIFLCAIQIERLFSVGDYNQISVEFSESLAPQKELKHKRCLGKDSTAYAYGASCPTGTENCVTNECPPSPGGD
jgi:hypothetical protein